MTDFIPRAERDWNDRTPIFTEMRCPYCGRLASLPPIRGNDVQWNQATGQPNHVEIVWAGLRRCSARDCNGVVFVVYRGKGELAITYPRETIDFDATQLPPAIKGTLEEAIKAHAAGCFRASALMVRRTLEEVCKDKKAQGGSLKERLGKLGSQTTIPSELLDAADEIRLLGNDAAHVDAREYDKIDKIHIEVAIELAKEILKGVYQYSALLQRLRDLKKPQQNNS